MYSCSACGHEMGYPHDVCPSCRAVLSGVRCNNCEHVDSKDVFIGNGHRCPKCNSEVRIPSRSTVDDDVDGYVQEAVDNRCPECKKKRVGGASTCEHCGHTEWGWVVLFLALGGAGIAGGLLLDPFSGFWLWKVAKWALVAIGAIVAWIGISDIWEAITGPQKLSPEDAVDDPPSAITTGAETGEPAVAQYMGGLSRAEQLTDLAGSQLDMIEASLNAMEQAHDSGDEEAKERIMAVVELSGDLTEALTTANPVEVELMLPKVEAASAAAQDGDFEAARLALDEVAALLEGSDRDMHEVLEAMKRFKARLEREIEGA